MKNSLFLTTALMVGTVLAAPRSMLEVLSKRYAPGNCGVHIYQLQRPNMVDGLVLELKDNDGVEFGRCNGSLGPQEEFYCTRELPFTISCTQTVDTHEVACCYNTPEPYCFGIHADDTGYGCTVGAWDNTQRDADCGFAC